MNTESRQPVAECRLLKVFTVCGWLVPFTDRPHLGGGGVRVIWRGTPLMKMSGDSYL